jgi:hypothetical protein
MKVVSKVLVLVAALGLISASAFGNEMYGYEYFDAAGNWRLSNNGQGFGQYDATQPLAKLNVSNAQLLKAGLLTIKPDGTYSYHFAVSYEGGLREDGHGGFGIHFFVPTSSILHDRASWGSGNSLLFWLNYDEAPLANSGIPKGLSFELYKSFSNSYMELAAAVDLNYLLAGDTSWMKDYQSYWVDLTININPTTGAVVVDNGNYFRFTYTIPASLLPLSGDWLTLRSNGMQVAYSYFY